jgi:hypothetical protein
MQKFLENMSELKAVLNTRPVDDVRSVMRTLEEASFDTTFLSYLFQVSMFVSDRSFTMPTRRQLRNANCNMAFRSCGI